MLQLDLEMSFATGKDVMRAVESLVSEIPAVLNAQFSMVKRGDDVYPVLKRSLVCTQPLWQVLPRLTPSEIYRCRETGYAVAGTVCPLSLPHVPRCHVQVRVRQT